MHPDGSDKHQIVGPLQRAENQFPLGSPPYCGAEEGILGLGDWSADGKWVSYIYKSSDQVGEDEVLYAVNIETGFIWSITSRPLSSNWSFTGSKIALITDVGLGSDSVDVVEVIPVFLPEQEGSSAMVFPMPSSLEQGSVLLYSIGWSSDEKGLFVISRTHSFDRPAILWQIDTRTGQWNKVLELGQLVLRFHANQTWASTCYPRERLEFWELPDWKTAGSVSPSEWIDCDTLAYLQDSAGNNLISFIDGWYVWGVIPRGTPAKPEKLIDGYHQLHFPEELDLLGVAWHP